jgi:hypothetical protein
MKRKENQDLLKAFHKLTDAAEAYVIQPLVNFVAQYGLEGESNEDKTHLGGCCLGDNVGIDARREGKSVRLTRQAVHL